MPLPGGPGTGSEHTTIYVQMPDTLALNVNSRVRVADVFVGRVRSIELKNWVATLTLDLEPRQAAGERAGQDRSDQPAGQPARAAGPAAGPVAAAVEERRHHSAEELVGVPDDRAGAGQHLRPSSRGGGISNLEVIQTEVEQPPERPRPIRSASSSNRLDTFTDELNQQREDITRAIDSTNRLLSIVANATTRSTGC